MRLFFAFLFIIFCGTYSDAQTTQEDSIRAFIDSLVADIDTVLWNEIQAEIAATPPMDSISIDKDVLARLDTAYASNLLKEAVTLIEKRLLDLAYAKADSARQIYITKTGYETKEVAVCLHQMGRVNNLYGNHKDAIPKYLLSIRIRFKCYNYIHFDIGTSFNNLGGSYEKIGQYDAAIVCHRNALEIRLRLLGFLHFSVGQTLNNLGICFERKGEIKKAITCHIKGLNLRIKNLGHSHSDVGQSYNNIGLCYNKIGEYGKATYYLNKGLENRIKSLGINHEDVGSSLNNLGINFYSLGDYTNSIIYLENGLNVKSKALKNKHFSVAYSYGNLGLSYKSIKNYKKALTYFLKGLEIAEFSLGKYHDYVGSLYENIGSIYEVTGDCNSAIKYYNLGLQIKEKSFGLNNIDVSNSYRNLGLAYEDCGKVDKAIEYFNKSLLIKLNLRDLYLQKIIDSYNDLSFIYYKIGKFDISCDFSSKAIDNFKNLNLFNFMHETKVYNLSNNLTTFENAINVSIIMPTQDGYKSIKLKTYEYSELAKASLLQSQIKQTDALAFAGIPDSLLQKEYDLRIDINWREKQRQGLLEKGKEETDQDVLRISSIIFDLKREQEALIERFEKDYPDYYQLKYDTKTITLEETQKELLRPDQSLLEYFVGDSSIFIFVVRPDTFHVAQIKRDFALDTLVKQLQFGLYGYYGDPVSERTDKSYKSSVVAYEKAAQKLYQRIVAPVASLLSKELIIVPDGVLGYVPFDALLKESPAKTGDFKTYPYLINDHNISYTYSATLLKQMREKKHKKPASKSLVAFAPFYQGTYAELDTTINLVFDTLPDGRDTTIFQDVVTRKDYAPLPSSGEEVKSASSLWKGDYFINSDATEQKFYDVAGDYRIVHLSTHGVADARQGDYSFLAFSEVKDSIENEYLYVRDIYNTQLNADLVVLSACETARGELQRGEGIISLARAFAYAGAKSMLTTLWVVDDVATKDIMKNFYIQLRKGNTKDTSLRNAKLKYIQTAKKVNRHPFFWASFIPLGDMGAVK